ncbi:response regulator [Marinobacter sp. OP 3.4]|uniref:response regulator n=1 Tax=Marinobacter sp. OP 3.4 TaxID=3076501 RepID=UPI002E1B9407
MARRKSELGTPRESFAPEHLWRLFRRLPWVRGARGFRLVSYSVVVLAAVMPALVWNSLSVPGDTWNEPALPFHGPVVLIGGILVLETALIFWVKMLQFGNERVWRRRKAGDPSSPFPSPAPVSPHGHDLPDPAEQEPADGGMPRVLVVDDDPINRMILRKQLLRLNVEPVSAADGMEALDTVQRGHWDMILMDGQMPRLDGPETALEIRLRELLPADVPIIGITTNDTPEFREQCLRAGMQACYHKPVRRFVIEKLVDFYIRQRVAEEPGNILDRTFAPSAQSAS